MSPRLLRPIASGVHPEANAWRSAVVANGGSVSASTMKAVSTFCAAIDLAGIRDRFYRLNLFAGTGLNAALVPLYRGPSRTGTQYGNTTDTNNGPFVSGDYAETTGLDSGAANSTKYLATGLTQDDLGTVASHLSFYQAQDTVYTVNRRVIGLLGEGNNLFIVRFSGSPVVLQANIGSTVGVTAADSIAGLTVVDRQAADSLKLFTDGTERSSIATTVSVTLPTLEYFVYNHNNGGVPVAAQYFQGALRSYSLGTSLGDAGVAAYTAAMTAFQTALGRAA
jgi:hypothetical protein